MISKTVLDVGEAHIDSLGHLNHVAAVRYLEAARNDWYTACGLYDGEGQGRFAAVVLNVNYDYKRECFLGERLSITTRPVSMGKKSFVLAHEIVKPDLEIAVSGKATSLIMDLMRRATIPVPSCMARYLAA